jgi:hypothetical protein
MDGMTECRGNFSNTFLMFNSLLQWVLPMEEEQKSVRDYSLNYNYLISLSLQMLKLEEYSKAS